MTDSAPTAPAKDTVVVEEEAAVVVTKKDPRKVEQGKRLAKISQEAKERKLRQKIEEENRYTLNTNLFYTSLPSMLYIGTAFFLGTYLYRRLTSSIKKEAEEVTPAESPPKKDREKQQQRFESFS